MSYAIVVERTGGPEVLSWQEVPSPTPAPDELLVEVGAAGVNFVDVYLRTGVYDSPLPLIPGKEGAGRVRAVGSDLVDQFAEGDRVAWAMGTGGYAQYATVPGALAVPIPDGVTDEQAAAVLLQGMTAHFLTHSILTLSPNDPALVHAGAGGVGLLLTQLLTRQGVQVISTVSTEQKAELSRAAGAAEVLIGYENFSSKVRELTGGRGVRIAYDGVGADTFDGSMDALRTRGTLVLFGAASGPVPPVDPQVLNAKGSLVLTRPSLSHFIADRAELTWRASDLFSGVENGELQVRIDATYRLADAARAHEDLEARRTTGKLLLRP